MGPSDPLPGLATLPAFLVQTAGNTRTRCLSDRHHRQVYLVEEDSGDFRVFKVLRHQSGPDLERFDAVCRRLRQEPRCPWLMTVLNHGVDQAAGIAWQELAVVDHADPGGYSLESYSPEVLLTAGVGDESGLVERVAGVGLELLRAMEHLHSMGLVHGDIKPSNVFRHRSKWVLGDFDSAVLSDSALSVSASTEGYRPPGGAIGPECDTYALGKVLYELWTGNDRLEYPNLPERLVSRTRWTRAERLLNDLINGLCSPVGLRRIRDLPFIRATLSALGSGSESEQIQAHRRMTLGQGPRRFVRPAAVVAVMVLVMLGWLVFRGGFHATRLVVFQENFFKSTVYRHPEGLNEGYVRPAALGEDPALLLFNTHLTRLDPLRTGDRVEMGLRKDVWRGHVDVYLSPHPIFQEPKAEFGHREHFGHLSHQMFFHVDGDEWVAPTAFHEGKPELLPPESWSQRVRTNNLQTYWLAMTVGAREVEWSVNNCGLEIAQGRIPRSYDPCYLGIYVYDNTLCYLRSLKVEHAPADGQ